MPIVTAYRMYDKHGREYGWCPRCDGNGLVDVERDDGPDVEWCQDCDGEGTVWLEPEREPTHESLSKVRKQERAIRTSWIYGTGPWEE